MERIGFIGMGNMGSAMLKGALKTFSPADITFYDPDESKRNAVSSETHVISCDSASDCVKEVKYLVLAIKPQVYDSVAKEIWQVVTQEHVIISLAPTISISQLEEQYGLKTRIIRAMPNTPALIGEGMTGLAAKDGTFTQEELSTVVSFFESFGKCKFVPENLMSAIVCASGSSPAYVYMFIEALADSCVKYGLSRQDAYEFAAQAVLGSAKMVLETGENPAKLKDNVCSPGGTTIRAVEALEENGFRNAIFKATKACFDKCEGRED